MAKKRFGDLPPAARVAIVLAGALEVGLLAAAQIDITRRPADRIRGSKRFWRLISLINVVGPIAYFRRGRVDLS
jgi:hypothetical protein